MCFLKFLGSFFYYVRIIFKVLLDFNFRRKFGVLIYIYIKSNISVSYCFFINVFVFVFFFFGVWYFNYVFFKYVLVFNGDIC